MILEAVILCSLAIILGIPVGIKISKAISKFKMRKIEKKLPEAVEKLRDDGKIFILDGKEKDIHGKTIRDIKKTKKNVPTKKDKKEVKKKVKKSAKPKVRT